MNMELVNSSSVVRVGHDDATLDMMVEFVNGSTYVYADVPTNVYDELISSPSIGKFINTSIKPKYLYTKV